MRVHKNGIGVWGMSRLMNGVGFGSMIGFRVYEYRFWEYGRALGSIAGKFQGGDLCMG